MHKTLSTEEARRLLDKKKIHYTPKQVSLIIMVEIELSILSRQCLDRRIPDQEIFKMEITAWQEKGMLLLGQWNGDLQLRKIG
ncbi:MAG: hypothetical protein PHO08_17400 [Methylococcales bacterium]|nr:hypothetical protein [Methylococcales bacterium]